MEMHIFEAFFGTILKSPAAFIHSRKRAFQNSVFSKASIFISIFIYFSVVDRQKLIKK